MGWYCSEQRLGLLPIEMHRSFVNLFFYVSVCHVVPCVCYRVIQWIKVDDEDDDYDYDNNDDDDILFKRAIAYINIWNWCADRWEVRRLRLVASSRRRAGGTPSATATPLHLHIHIHSCIRGCSATNVSNQPYSSLRKSLTFGRLRDCLGCKINVLT